MSEQTREELIQDFHNIIRTVSLSRAAVETSTPAQIVWMTAEAIAENLQNYASGVEGYFWYPRERVLGSIIRRAVEDLKLPPKTFARVDKAIVRAIEGWPS